MVVTVPEKTGYTLEQNLLIASLVAIQPDSDRKIEAEINVTPAEVRRDNLTELGIVEKISTGWSTFTGSPVNRIHNIKTGASKFNQVLIKPGERFSFNTTLGPVNAATGYLPELVILVDKTVPQYGGGLCQVSSTAFRAALNAGFPIIERRAHAYPVSYYRPYGVDATIYLPKPDLVFENDSGRYVLIQTRIEGKRLYFDFFGTKVARTIKFAGNREVSGAVEEVEAYEELEEAGELEEARAVESADEVEELEEADAVDEIEQLEELEELDELAAAAGAGNSASIADGAADLEALGEVEEYEELEEAEELADSQSVSMVDGQMPTAGSVQADPSIMALRQARESLPSGNDEIAELEEIDGDTEAWGSLSAEALALSSEDDDTPIIPETLGLELVEEVDLAEVMGYLSRISTRQGTDSQVSVHADLSDTVDEDSRELELSGLFGLESFEDVGPENDSHATSATAESNEGDESTRTEDGPSLPELTFESPFEELDAVVMDLEGSETGDKADALPSGAPISPVSFISPDETIESDDDAEAVDFDLTFSSLDLSGLTGYFDEEGFLELDERPTSPAVPDVQSGEADVVVPEDGVITMLSDSERNHLEELYPDETSDDSPAELEPLPQRAAFVQRRVLWHRPSSSAPVEGYLPVVENDEAGFAANLEPLDDADDGDAATTESDVIVMKDGVFTIDRQRLTRSAPVDDDLKALADSVIGPNHA